MNNLVSIPVKKAPDQTKDPYDNRKGYMSWQQTVRRISQMTVSQLKARYQLSLEKLDQYPDDATLRELAVMSAMVETIERPNPAILNMLMERDEGRVPQSIVSASGSIGDWMEYAKQEGIPIEQVMEEADKLLREYNEVPKVVEGEIVE